MDATTRALAIAANRLSIDVNLEFLRPNPGQKRPVFTTGPLFAVMLMARQDAIQALGAMPHVDPKDIESVRKLQNEVQRYFDLVTYVKKIFDAGDEAHAALEADAEDELREQLRAEGAELPEES